jgi:hypothetical protein
MKQKNMTTSQSRNTVKRSWLRYGLFSVALVLACFGLSPTAQAVSPPPDGGYPNANTAEGQDALFNLNIGLGNTAIGFEALYSNTAGHYNTAIGFQAMFNNTEGAQNTAIGTSALQGNINGVINTATGVSSLASNTYGAYNTANGGFALTDNTTGSANTASGFQALLRNTTATGNTANGASALLLNTTGNGNTAIGQSALRHNTTGKGNIALGQHAGINLTTGNNNIDIFDRGVADESDTIRIGKQGTQTATFIAGINGTTVPTGVAVIIDSTGHLGTTTSSARFKDAIKPIDKASEAILALNPVTFRYKHELDPAGIPQFGLVAEEVEKVNRDLVARDKDGKAYGVRYEAVNAMLLNEFLKEHKAFIDEQHKVERLEATVANLASTVKEQAAQIQKVSAQLEASKSAPQVVNNR